MDGYIDYQRREYCNDVKCPVQEIINKHGEDSKEYETLHKVCKEKCLSTTYDFHHWLIQKGYLLVRKEE